MGETYSHGQIAMGSGNLLDVYSIDITVTTNKKVINTLQKKGVCTGPEEATVNFSAKLPDTGEEADWLALVKAKALSSLRLKIPNRTLTLQGGYGEVKYGISIDDATDVALSFVGHTVT